MSGALVTLALLFGVAAAAVPQKTKALLAARKAPDEDHFIDEIHENAQLPAGAEKTYFKPSNSMLKDFASLDYNGDKVLEQSELMWRQYASGCEPIEAEVRANDYMQCGDTNGDDVISLQEYADFAKPSWIECVKLSKLRRAHGFVKFFDSDQNMDDKLSIPELTVGLIRLWGPPGEQLSEPLMKCSDKNGDGFMDQKEFHDSIFAYNPATASWQKWKGTSDESILKCMEAAMKTFDAALVFHATDKNKDGRLSQQELYDTVEATNPATIDQKHVDALIKAADKDKNGWLSVDEFAGAGAAWQGPKEAPSFFLSRANATAAWPLDTYNEGYGMSVSCHSNDEGNQWRVYSDDFGAVRVTPTDDKGGVKVTVR